MLSLVWSLASSEALPSHSRALSVNLPDTPEHPITLLHERLLSGYVT